jgi:hypothetical protein
MLHNRELVTVESIDFRVLGTLLCSALLNRLFQPVVTSEAFTTYIEVNSDNNHHLCTQLPN